LEYVGRCPQARVLALVNNGYTCISLGQMRPEWLFSYSVFNLLQMSPNWFPGIWTPDHHLKWAEALHLTGPQQMPVCFSTFAKRSSCFAEDVCLSQVFSLPTHSLRTRRERERERETLSVSCVDPRSMSTLSKFKFLRLSLLLLTQLSSSSKGSNLHMRMCASAITLFSFGGFEVILNICSMR